MSTTRRSNRYKHEPLQSPSSAIRLLTLEPDNETHFLCCSVESFELGSCPPYTALSYEWGEVEPPVEISINKKWFLIRHNLFLFLSKLNVGRRDHALSKDIRFWVDAICIDQTDLCERNAQVSMMGDIYRNANSVFAWLGWPNVQHSKTAFDFIKKGRSLDPDGDMKGINVGKSTFWGLTNVELLQMLLQMCNCRYWSRRWIVQEILLARDVIIFWGDNELSWISMHLFFQRLAGLRVPSLFSIMLRLEKTVPFIMSRYLNGAANKEALAILQLLYTFRATECEVLHDKVYSLLSLASDGKTIPVHYDCSPEQLLWKILRQSESSFRGYLDFLIEDFGVWELLSRRTRRIDEALLPWGTIEQIDRSFNKGLDSLKETSGVFGSSQRSNSGGDEEECSNEVETSRVHEEFIPCQRILRCTMPFYVSAREGAKIPREVESRAHGSQHNSFNSTEILCMLEDSQYEYSSYEYWYTGRTEVVRVVFFEDGGFSVACASASPGHLLYDFIPRRKLVLGKGSKFGLQLIGMATPPVAIRRYTTMPPRSRDDEVAIYNTDGTIIEEVLLDMSGIVTGSDGKDVCSSKTDLSSEKEAIRGSFNVLDLIQLARCELNVLPTAEPSEINSKKLKAILPISQLREEHAGQVDMTQPQTSANDPERDEQEDPQSPSSLLVLREVPGRDAQDRTSRVPVWAFFLRRKFWRALKPKPAP